MEPTQTNTQTDPQTDVSAEKVPPTAALVYPAVTKPLVTIDEFAKMDMRVGTIIAAEAVPETDKLIKCTIDFGPLGTRTVVSGIKEYRAPETLVGKQVPYIVNLEPRKIKGIESQGMLLAMSHGENDFALLNPDVSVPPGTCIK